MLWEQRCYWDVFGHFGTVEKMGLYFQQEVTPKDDSQNCLHNSFFNWWHFPNQRLVESWLLSLDAWRGVNTGLLLPRQTQRAGRWKEWECALSTAHKCYLQLPQFLLGVCGGSGGRKEKQNACLSVGALGRPAGAAERGPSSLWGHLGRAPTLSLKWVSAV